MDSTSTQTNDGWEALKGLFLVVTVFYLVWMFLRWMFSSVGSFIGGCCVILAVTLFVSWGDHRLDAGQENSRRLTQQTQAMAREHDRQQGRVSQGFTVPGFAPDQCENLGNGGYICTHR